MKPLLLAVVLSLSVAVSFSSQVLATSAGKLSETNGSALDTGLYGNILDHQLYYFLVGCFAQATEAIGTNQDTTYKLSSDNVSSWDLFEPTKQSFGNSRESVRGAMYDKVESGCDDQTYTQEAFKTLGFTDPFDFVCSLNFAYNSTFGGLGGDGAGAGSGRTKANCLAGKNNGDSAFIFKQPGSVASFLAEAESQLTSTSEGAAAKGGLSNNEEYIRAYRTLAKQCDVTLIKNYGQVDPVLPSGQQSVYIVNSDGTWEVWGATMASSDKKVKLVATRSPGGSQEVTCSQLLGTLSSTGITYAKYVKDATDGGNPISSSLDTNANCEAGDASCANKTTCAIENIGWILCPVMKFMGKIVDVAYTWISGLLTVQPVTQDNTTLFSAWSTMRNIANALFVIAFLIIIYSQITGVGITNYGIKKMIPKLIIAALLVNVSYWLCSIAVDVSNILGTSAKGLFGNLGIETPFKSTDAATLGTSWEGLTGGLLAGTLVIAGGLYLGLSVLLPALITAIAAIVIVFLVLTLRQALIILLIVISPLAFVAYLLPNTEQWFKKWRELFQTLLLMFPIIGAIFGASALASQIVMSSAFDENGDPIFSIQVMGALISILPLALTPIVMKTAGGVLNRFGGIINNPNKGPFDRLRKGAEGYRGRKVNQMNNNALNNGGKFSPRARLLRRQARSEAIDSSQKQGIEASKAGYISKLAQEKDSDLLKQMAAGGGEGANTRALANAINVQLELETKEVKAAGAVIEHANLPSEALNSLAKGLDAGGFSGKDDAFRKAAISSAVSMGTVGDVEEIIKSAGSMSGDQQKILASSIASSGIASKATHLGGQTLDDIAQGNVTSEADLDKVTARAIEKGKYSAEKIADSDPDALKRVVGVLSQGRADVSTDKVTAIREQANLAATDDRIKSRLTDSQKPHLDQLR
ncbi:MAG: O-antigen polymerase [Candidatus Saccharibacteria bacterium]